LLPLVRELDMSEFQARESRKYEFPTGEEGIFQMDPDLDDEERDLSHELHNLPTRELLQLLRARNISVVGITEKADLVRAYVEYERAHR
jgi:hypothetical protein